MWTRKLACVNSVKLSSIAWPVTEVTANTRAPAPSAALSSRSDFTASRAIVSAAKLSAISCVTIQALPTTVVEQKVTSVA